MIRRSKPLVIAVAVLAAFVVLIYSRWAFELIRGLRTSADLGKVGAGNAEKLPRVIAALADSNPIFRQAAAEALARIGPAASAARPALVACFRDAGSQVRSSAARALGMIGPAADVIPALTKALDDEVGEVRRYASLGSAAWPRSPRRRYPHSSNVSMTRTWRTWLRAPWARSGRPPGRQSRA
jgi:HEAT repeat protein